MEPAFLAGLGLTNRGCYISAGRSGDRPRSTSNTKMLNLGGMMKIQKLLGLAAIALDIVGAFVVIPSLTTILVILGLIGGLWIDGPDHVRVIVSALALTALSGVLNSIPGVGGYLANIFVSFGVLAAGAAIMIILRNMYARFKP